MNKVIRTARISDHTVVLPIHVNPEMIELPEVLDGEVAEDNDTGFTPLDEQVEVVDDVVNPVEEPEPEEIEIDVEAIVAERLQEAEARFQEEKERAVQASYDEGQTRGAEEGHARGMEEGHARGLEEGQAQSHDEIVRFQSMLSALAERWSDVFKTADQDLTELAMVIAHNLVGGLVDKYEDLVLGAVRDCLTHLQDRSRVVIRVNPDDLSLVREHREEWQRVFEQIESLVVEADETIGRGGCLVETPSGDIDAQIESRLAKLQTALMEAVQNAPAEQPPDFGETDVNSTSSDDVSEAVEDEALPNAVVDLDETSESVETETLDEGANLIDLDEGTEVVEDDATELIDSDEVDEDQNMDLSSESDGLNESDKKNDAAEESDQLEDLMEMDDEEGGVGEDESDENSDTAEESDQLEDLMEMDDEESGVGEDESDKNSDTAEESDQLEDLMEMDDEESSEEDASDEDEDDVNNTEPEEGNDSVS